MAGYGWGIRRTVNGVPSTSDLSSYQMAKNLLAEPLDDFRRLRFGHAVDRLFRIIFLIEQRVGDALVIENEFPLAIHYHHFPVHL